MRGPTVIDLFAGPGGWDLAARDLGMDPLGIEWDDAACATRRAAGLRTLQADVAQLDPLDFAPCVGLIASPPCQAWSMAGKGGGRRDRDHVIRCLGDLAAGNDTRAEHAAECEDERSMLVVEPLRWILALNPEWVALEQVPPVLELWTMVAQILSLKGYSTWAGVLEAERYGVPQTRERAILMASRVAGVSPPRPTHQRYVPGQPQRHDVTFDGEILPWVSMAEALGRVDGVVPSPAPTVTGGGTEGGGGAEVFASRDARNRARQAMGMRLRRGEGLVERHGDRPDRPESAPAPTITSKVRSAEWAYRNGNQANAAERPIDTPAPTIHFGHASNKVDWVVRTGNFTAVKRDADGSRSREGSAMYERPIDAPAPVVTGNVDRWTCRRGTGRSTGQPTVAWISTGAGSEPTQWEGATSDGRRLYIRFRDGRFSVYIGAEPGSDPLDGTTLLELDDIHFADDWHPTDAEMQELAERVLTFLPAVPVSTRSLQAPDWPEGRPATTIAGDSRVFQPGGHHQPGSQSKDAVRVTVQEAAVLQSFPPDYPWQGSRSKQYEQCGNAIPPLLARAILGQFVGAFQTEAGEGDEQR